MQVFNLQAIPNQSFVTTQDGNRYEIRIFEANGCMAADITINGTVTLKGARISSGTPLIPFKYLQALNGNFVFICQTEDIVYYNLFGLSQQLYYFSNIELQALPI